MRGGRSLKHSRSKQSPRSTPVSVSGLRGGGRGGQKGEGERTPPPPLPPLPGQFPAPPSSHASGRSARRRSRSARRASRTVAAARAPALRPWRERSAARRETLRTARAAVPPRARWGPCARPPARATRAGGLAGTPRRGTSDTNLSPSLGRPDVAKVRATPGFSPKRTLRRQGRHERSRVTALRPALGGGVRERGQADPSRAVRAGAAPTRLVGLFEHFPGQTNPG